MRRVLLLVCVLLGLNGCQTAEPKRTFALHGRTYCVKHRIALVTARGFEAPSGIVIHGGVERYYPCEEQFPNHIWATRSLHRSKIEACSYRFLILPAL